MKLRPDFLSIKKIFEENMYVIKDELDHIEDKIAKIIQIFLAERSDPDLLQLFRILPDPNPRHWLLTRV